MSAEATYWQQLETVVAAHPAAVARAFRLRPGFLEPREAAIVVNYALSERLTPFSDGSLDEQTVLQALGQLPPETRHPRTAVDALAWYERGQTQGRRIPDVLRQGPLFQAAIERAFGARRRERTERSMHQLVENNRQLAAAIDELVRALGQPDGQPASRGQLRAILKRMQAILRSSEWHARAAAAWAVKNGFALEGVGRAIHRLLLQPLRRMAHLTAELEQRLNLPRREHCSQQIERICRRILLELMDASAVEWERRQGSTTMAG